MTRIDNVLRFYFITDEDAANLTPVKQVRIVLEAGATMVQYRNKRFGLPFYQEVIQIRNLCQSYNVPFMINDNVLLAKATGADGVHLGQQDDSPGLARQILGPQAIIGLSVSTPQELNQSDTYGCNYLGSGPVFKTLTKSDAKPVRSLEGLKEVAGQASLPVVAIGGICASNAADCFAWGAAGVAVISAITRSDDPAKAARELADVCYGK
ncbi:MAG: thiamine phosphate synthase [Desulfobacteraceae bacterium]|nr:thiamine phosphate synthase [Desulfobacteraceae bacterium]